MCFDCAKQEPDRHCLECKYFIQPGPLHRILSPPVQVILEGERFNQYPAQIIALNTKEFGLKNTSAGSRTVRNKVTGKLMGRGCTDFNS